MYRLGGLQQGSVWDVPGLVVFHVNGFTGNLWMLPGTFHGIYRDLAIVLVAKL